MSVCEKVGFSWWVVDGKVVLQLGDGIDGSRLGRAIHILAFGTLCAG